MSELTNAGVLNVGVGQTQEWDKRRSRQTQDFWDKVRSGQTQESRMSENFFYTTPAPP